MKLGVWTRATRLWFIYAKGLSSGLNVVACIMVLGPIAVVSKRYDDKGHWWKPEIFKEIDEIWASALVLVMPTHRRGSNYEYVGNAYTATYEMRSAL